MSNTMSNRTLGDWVLDAASFLNEFKEDSSTGRETNSRAALAAELARDASRFVGEDDISPTIINLDSVMNSLSNYHEWRRSETYRKREILGHMFYAMMGADPKSLPKTEDEFAHSSLIIDALNHYGTDDPAKPVIDAVLDVTQTETGDKMIDLIEILDKIREDIAMLVAVTAIASAAGLAFAIGVLIWRFGW